MEEDHSLSDYQQGIFYVYHPTDRIVHTTAFVTPVVEYWMEWETPPVGGPSFSGLA